MQVNRISMESAKCAQSNKTCRQSEIWYLFAKIRVKGQNDFFLLFLQWITIYHFLRPLRTYCHLFFPKILSSSQNLCQELICVTFHDFILLTNLWNYGSDKYWLSFQIISAICTIYMHFVTYKCVRVFVERIQKKIIM